MLPTERSALLARVEKAEAERDALTETLKSLEEALAKAESQNAATLAEHMGNIMAQIGAAVVGEDGTAKLAMECACPYCHNISYSIEEAAAHDATCEKHPAVIRLAKVEADRAALVEALQKMKMP